MVYGKLARAEMAVGVYGMLARVSMRVTPPPAHAYGMLDHVVMRATETTSAYGMLARVVMLTAPGVNAGADQYGIEPGAPVVLTGSDEAAGGATRVWTQLTGPTVTLTGTGKTRTFLAPASIDGTTLTFGYSVDGSSNDVTTVGVLGTTEFAYAGGNAKSLLMFGGPWP